MIPVVAVFGSRDGGPAKLAAEVGTLVARRGWSLLTGGGPGCMRAALDGFLGVEDRNGIAIAVTPTPDAPDGKYDLHVPTEMGSQKAPVTEMRRQQDERLDKTWMVAPGYPELVNSRNMVNAFACSFGVAVSTTAGTANEIAWMEAFGKPWVLVGGEADWKQLAARVNGYAKGLPALPEEPDERLVADAAQAVAVAAERMSEE